MKDCCSSACKCCNGGCGCSGCKKGESCGCGCGCGCCKNDCCCAS